MQNEIIYSWERLPVYEWTNQFSRLIGRMLVSVPARLHVQIHCLIGQTTVMSNAIPGAHRDLAPGDDEVPVVERRVWLTIGICACHSARDILSLIGRECKGAQPDIRAGMKLLSQIEATFQETLDTLNPPAVRSLAAPN